MALSYKHARDARKSTGDITIEPLNPSQGPVVDKTKPAPKVGIEPLPLPDRTNLHSPEVAHPDDIGRPTFSDVKRT